MPKWIFGSPSLPIIYLKAANLWRVVGLAEDGTCEERIIVDERLIHFHVRHEHSPGILRGYQLLSPQTPLVLVMD